MLSKMQSRIIGVLILIVAGAFLVIANLPWFDTLTYVGYGLFFIYLGYLFFSQYFTGERE